MILVIDLAAEAVSQLFVLSDRTLEDLKWTLKVFYMTAQCDFSIDLAAESGLARLYFESTVGYIKMADTFSNNKLACPCILDVGI